MTTFWLAILSLIVIALLIVWRIFSSSKDTLGAENINIRQETNVTLYHEHLAQLETDLAEGSIEQDSFVQLKAELDKTLLQDASSSESVRDTKATTWIWPLGIAIALMSFSFFSYMKLGAYPLLNSPTTSAMNEENKQITPEQMMAFRLQQLEQVVIDEPENAEAWFSLGQAYISIGEFDNAIAAFDKVIAQVGIHAELLGPKAQAMYYKNNQQINADIQQVIDQALALDALDPATNILLGMNSFSNRDFANAVKYWEVVLNSDRPGISTDALAEAVAEAKNQLRLSNEESAGVEHNKSSDTSLPQLTVDVSLAQSLQEKLQNDEDKVVFIYAIAANGPRMPLAAVKLKTSDLPISIVLDDSQAMTPQMRLSSVNKVNIYAVVSMQGSVGIKSGDFKAEVLNVDTMKKSPIAMEISIQVP